MKVEIVNKKDLLIDPETDFEERFLECFQIGEVFLKRGVTPKEVVGILIKHKED